MKPFDLKQPLMYNHTMSQNLNVYEPDGEHGDVNDYYAELERNLSEEDQKIFNSLKTRIDKIYPSLYSATKLMAMNASSLEEIYSSSVVFELLNLDHLYDSYVRVLKRNKNAPLPVKTLLGLRYGTVSGVLEDVIHTFPTEILLNWKFIFQFTGRAGMLTYLSDFLFYGKPIRDFLEYRNLLIGKLMRSNHLTVATVFRLFQETAGQKDRTFPLISAVLNSDYVEAKLVYTDEDEKIYNDTDKLWLASKVLQDMKDNPHGNELVQSVEVRAFKHTYSKIYGSLEEKVLKSLGVDTLPKGWLDTIVEPL